MAKDDGTIPYVGAMGQRRAMEAIDQELLDETVRRIVGALQPEAIYLYGSHAYGQSHQDSDVDLFVVVSGSALPPHRRAVAAYRALRGLFLPAEVTVATREEFERQAQLYREGCVG
jgi:predicted nucleotidyltransferase